ncbi:MAG: hypothetical protein ACRDHY_04365 [Anaerolineales bacterium]
MNPEDPGPRAYVRAVLDLYVRLPGTRLTPSRQDRRLAATLHQRGLPLTLVRTALLLAAARRALRSPEAPPLPPVGCLHYFLPVIDEVGHTPPDPGYVQYLAAKLQPLMKPASTIGQKTSLPGGR